jgi:PiT family inorganic phosphate transporter
MGVGLANALLTQNAIGNGINWAEVSKVFRSLLISPLTGFVLAAALLLVAKSLLKKRLELFTAPPKDQPPPRWVRGLLILTCTGVSFAHGSNDGQKGMGLMLLILIGILPGAYALNPSLNAASLAKLHEQSVAMQPQLVEHAGHATVEDPGAEVSSYLRSGEAGERTFAALAAINQRLAAQLQGQTSLEAFGVDQRKAIRTDMYLLGSGITKLVKAKQLAATPLAKTLEGATQFIPFWVKLMVALALGLGTMIGWKRIVVTVGEKIGKDHLTYAQGASAELVAMATILAADQFHLPVSTTHVLSSGIAGTMAANRSGLQTATLRNLLLAWVLTLPMSVMLGAVTFAAGLYIVIHSLVLHAVAVAGVASLVFAFLLMRRMSAQRATA